MHSVLLNTIHRHTNGGAVSGYLCLSEPYSSLHLGTLFFLSWLPLSSDPHQLGAFKVHQTDELLHRQQRAAGGRAMGKNSPNCPQNRFKEY